MNKLLSTLLLGVLAHGAATASVDYKWSHLIDTPSAQDMASAVITAKDGKAVSFSHFGSKTAEDGINYAGETVAFGAATSSNSDNRNLLIMKHGDDGKALWTVSTKEGYVDTANGFVAATSDGGVVALIKLRGSLNGDVIAPVFVDAQGEKPLASFNTSDWVYNMVVLKISANGEIEWIRPFDQSQLAVGLAEADILDGITPYGLCVDDEDNIYVGGNYRTPVIAWGVNNSCFALQPRNVADYSGNSQNAAGGLFLIKLDKEGNYLNNLKSAGTDTRDQICGLDYNDGKVYFFGNIQGAEGDVVTVGDKQVSLPNGLDNLMYGSVNKDMTVNYVGLAKGYAASDGKETLQCKGIKVIDGGLYMLGSVKGGLGSGDGESALVETSGTMLQGFALKCDASNGDLKSGHIYSEGISAYMGVFKYDGVTYLYGYRMNATEGCVLESFSNDDNWTYTETDGKISLMLGGGAPTAYGSAFEPTDKMLYVMARGNKAFTFYNTEAASEAPQGFGGILTAYSLAGTNVNVESTQDVAFMVSTELGGVKVIGNSVRVVIVNAAGVTEADQVVDGEAFIALPAGVHMVNDRKVIVK